MALVCWLSIQFVRGGGTIDAGFHLVPDDNRDDPMWIVPPSPVDAPMLAGPLSKARREDLQTFGFIFALVGSGAEHPLGVRPGSDPPDRELFVGGKEWPLELTELTAPAVRQELAQVRAVGRGLQDRLREDTRFKHLEGRHVGLSFNSQPGDVLPKQITPTLDAVAELLSEDLGCVGDGMDLSDGLPETWTSKAGFYGSHGPFLVVVHRGEPGAIVVSAAAQVEITRSEAQAALQERVEAKDKAGGGLLLVTCGLPDTAGYVCPLDHFIFHFIAEDIKRGELTISAQHLSSVVLHDWGSGEWVEAYRAKEASAPWVGHSSGRGHEDLT